MLYCSQEHQDHYIAGKAIERFTTVALVPVNVKITITGTEAELSDDVRDNEVPLDSPLAQSTQSTLSNSVTILAVTIIRLSPNVENDSVNQALVCIIAFHQLARAGNIVVFHPVIFVAESVSRHRDANDVVSAFQQARDVLTNNPDKIVVIMFSGVLRIGVRVDQYDAFISDLSSTNHRNFVVRTALEHSMNLRNMMA